MSCPSPLMESASAQPLHSHRGMSPSILCIHGDTELPLQTTQHFSQGGGGHFRDVSQTVIAHFKYYSYIKSPKMWEKDGRLSPDRRETAQMLLRDWRGISMMNLSSLSWRCILCFVEQQERGGGREADTVLLIPEALMIQPASITEREHREQFPGLNRSRPTRKVFRGALCSLLCKAFRLRRDFLTTCSVVKNNSLNLGNSVKYSQHDQETCFSFAGHAFDYSFEQ